MAHKPTPLSVLFSALGQTASAAPGISANIESRKEEQRKVLQAHDQKELEAKNKFQNELDLLGSIDPDAAQLMATFGDRLTSQGRSLSGVPSNLSKTFITQAEQQREQRQQEEQMQQLGSVFGQSPAETGTTVPENLQFQNIDFTGFAQDVGLTSQSGATPTGQQEQAPILQNLMSSLSSLQQFGGVDVAGAAGDPVQRARLTDLIQGGGLPPSGFATAPRGRKVAPKVTKPEFSEKELKNKFSADRRRIQSDNRKIEKDLVEWKRVKRSLDNRLDRANPENKAFVREQLAEHELTRPVKTPILKFGKWKKQFFQSFENGAETKDINTMTEAEVDAETARLRALE